MFWLHDLPNLATPHKMRLLLLALLTFAAMC